MASETTTEKEWLINRTVKAHYGILINEGNPEKAHEEAKKRFENANHGKLRDMDSKIIKSQQDGQTWNFTFEVIGIHESRVPATGLSGKEISENDALLLSARNYVRDLNDSDLKDFEVFQIETIKDSCMTREYVSDNETVLKEQVEDGDYEMA